MATNKNQVAKEAATDQTAAKYVSRVKQRYVEEVVPYLIKRFNYTNVNQVPKLVKITLNTGLGDVKDNAKSVQLVQEEMKQIAGQ
ncbi:MAG: 50S ribosomal protein L5, partial [Clostridia bacterium]|nr:50S ribosomal protein L5 [Clostridia bacterium]